MKRVLQVLGLGLLAGVLIGATCRQEIQTACSDLDRLNSICSQVSPRPSPTIPATASTTPSEQTSTPTPVLPPTSTATTATAAPTVAGTSTSTATPNIGPSPTSVAVPVRPPVAEKMNGGQVPDPKTGKVGFTAFFDCVACKHRFWPCDQGHVHWTAVDGGTCHALDDVGNSICGSCDHVLATEPGSDAAAMCTMVCTSSAPGIARTWDPTCASVGNSFIRVVAGSVAINQPGNCYEAYLSGQGTYLVVLAAGARVCVDPADYIGMDSPPCRDRKNCEDDYARWERNSPYAPNGHCPHGEVVLTVRELAEGPFTVSR